VIFRGAELRNVPSNANSKRPLGPVSPLDYGHFAPQVAAWAIENLVRVAMFLGIEAIMGMGRPIVRVRVRHGVEVNYLKNPTLFLHKTKCEEIMPESNRRRREA
jgi:hypothetical protein